MNALAPSSEVNELVNYDAEKAFLGACMASNPVYERCADKLRPEHFADALHARIYDAIGKLIDQGSVADPLTLRTTFQGDPALAEAGGAMYLVNLASSVVIIDGAEDYAEHIVDLARRREMKALLEKALAAVDSRVAGVTADSVLEQIDQGLAQCTGPAEQRATVSGAGAAVHAALVDADDAHKRGGLGGITTGLIDLDKATSGLHAPDMIVLAGRPGMGKTVMADTIALAAARDGKRTVFFTIEMSNTQQGQRLIASEAGISVEKLRSGNLTQPEFEAVMRVRDDVSEIPLWFDDDPNITVDAMQRRCRRLKRSKGLDLIIVDYLQLTRTARGDRRAKLYEEVTELSRGMKGLAKMLEVPVLVLSQLSRDVEKRDDKRPVLSDLRESGAIEQDADSVWFAYREEYYLQNSEPKRRDTETDGAFMSRWQAHESKLAACRNVGEIIIAKNRHGPLRTVPLRFNGPRQRFENLAQ